MTTHQSRTARRMCREGYRVWRIARELGMSKSAVAGWLVANGVATELTIWNRMRKR